ncbi:hypothetical protein TVAG_068430 [Trichomonas vaginalis G3]|uniref:Uncharacterized protein n=1 Tax=Trichomonas vaginalis (strain ATCC PRA-98 / G3) TaxID=412133 RepID=A2FL49_TRIV3|nr:hypothetical protein TVAGG3_0847010 [Trichomonas vaginalis G3]EAX94375.1 hypothetical protein TVAG_068430 [Trichomonas vaginalis G3]KAI5499694.1 hypothetical protein TVAGG3_0847010 [Trichomonas vaginalis G3]|eukprot:XP_001307305.1 hypothetical protein [Trichomonas vaginalis G3]
MDSDVKQAPDIESNEQETNNEEETTNEPEFNDENPPLPTESPLFVEQEVIKPESEDQAEVQSTSSTEANPNTFPLTGYESPIVGDSESTGESKKSEIEVSALFHGVPTASSKKSKKTKKKKTKPKPEPSKLPPLTQSSSSTNESVPIQAKIENEIGKRTRSMLVEQKRQKAAEDLQKKIEEKDQKTRETLYNNSAANYQRACEKCIAEQQKVAIVANRRSLQMSEYQMHCMNKIQRNEEAERRAMEIQYQKVQKMQERAADRWLKQHIAAQVSQQIERRRESAARQKVRREAERLAKIERELAEKRQKELEEKRIIENAIMKMGNSSRN